MVNAAKRSCSDSSRFSLIFVKITAIFGVLGLSTGYAVNVCETLEAPPGIEPGYTDLQSAASPLRHGAVSTSAV